MIEKYHKLNEEQKREIVKKYYEEGIRTPKLAKLFGCSTNNVWRIVKRHEHLYKD